MFVASRNGTEWLDLEFADPLIDSYHADGALDPGFELQSYRRNHAHQRDHRAVQRRDLRHS